MSLNFLQAQGAFDAEPRSEGTILEDGGADNKGTQNNVPADDVPSSTATSSAASSASASSASTSSSTSASLSSALDALASRTGQTSGALATTVEELVANSEKDDMDAVFGCGEEVGVAGEEVGAEKKAEVVTSAKEPLLPADPLAAIGPENAPVTPIGPCENPDRSIARSYQCPADAELEALQKMEEEEDDEDEDDDDDLDIEEFENLRPSTSC